MNSFSYLIDTIEDLAKEPFGYDINDLDKSDWRSISGFDSLSPNFIRTNHEKLFWSELIESQSLTEELIDEFNHYITRRTDWDQIIRNYNELSKEFIIKYQNKFIIDSLFEYQKVPFILMKKYMVKNPYEAYELILNHQKLTTKVLKLFEDFDVIDWLEVSKGDLTLLAMEEFSNELYWNVISEHRNLKESSIRKFKDKVSWKEISKYQKMSKEFILEFSNYVDIEYLKQNRLINQQELKENETFTLLSLLQTM
ncbi:hypothetical protein D3C87_80260 [compost metagenome]